MFIQPCPCCGYCPTCGRSLGQYQQPFFPPQGITQFQQAMGGLGFNQQQNEILQRLLPQSQEKQ